MINRRKFINLLVPLLLASFGFSCLFTYQNDAYADECETDENSFCVWAGVRVEADYEGGAVGNNPSVQRSNKIIANGDGTYRFEKDRISVDGYEIKFGIEGRNLKIWTDGAGGKCNPTYSATVGFRNDIKAFRDAITEEINEQNNRNDVWGYTCTPFGGGTSFTVQIKFNVDDVTNPNTVEVPSGVINETDESNPIITEATCMSAAGTTLGWVLCPISDALNGAAGWAYDSLLKPALEINPQLFTQESSSSTGNTSATTQQAWDVFRNIANTLFIILFLVVIFSQLTGVGIDNYGIKKILPKLIVAAVLMNLSYWICLVFVDLSNILGNSLQSLLTNLPPANNQLPETVGGVDFGERFWEGAGGVATFVAVLGVLAGGVGVSIMAAGGGVAFLISILVAGLGAVVGIFFLFLLLAAREAAIVVLVVISPLAFACNMLPNTQDLFKKWWQIGWKLLLVYPIAGLLIGGGDYVSRLLLLSGAGGEGFFSAFAAIIVGIVPIFFIPSVLKSSFAAMGNLGAKISGIGQKVGGQLSGATDKTIRGSERFKNYQSDRDRQRRIRAATRTAARLGGRDLDPNSRQGRAYSQAQSILINEQAETRNREHLMNGGFEAAMAGIDAKARDDEVSNQLALMQNQGLTMGDGSVKSYTLGNMMDRMNELEAASRNRALTASEYREMGALARGMVQEKGGAGQLSKIIKGGSNAGNQNFVNAMRNINRDDSTVRAKVKEKSQGMGAYLEGGAGTSGTYAQYQNTAEYANEMKNRIKNHQVGLSQSGDDMEEYLASISASQDAKEVYQNIMDDQTFLATLDDADRIKVMNAARNAGVTGTTTQTIQQQQVQQAAQHTQNMQDMTDEIKKLNQQLSQHGGGGNP